MPSWYFFVVVDILLHSAFGIYLIENVNGHLVVLDVYMSQNVVYFTVFLCHKKTLIATESTRHKKNPVNYYKVKGYLGRGEVHSHGFR